MKLKIIIGHKIIILKLGKLTYMDEKRSAVNIMLFKKRMCIVNILKMLITLEKTERVDC